MNWHGTTAVVTGATRGIGRCVVEMLVSRGARVGAIARSAADLEQLAAGTGGAGQIVWAPADVAVRAEVEGALGALAEELGTPDVLVNNAGVGLHGPVARLDPADAERLMRCNYLGTVYATCAVLPAMLERRRGHVVNVGSVAGRLGAPFEAAYSASKFAVVGFTEALAIETAPFGVHVAMVNPGPVDTGFFEARGHPYDRRRPRPVPPAQVAGAVIRAVEGRRFEQLVPRSLGAALGIRHLVPGLYLSGTKQAFRKELAALADEVGHR